MRASLKRWPDLWVLAGGVSLTFVFSAVLIWVVPPNNNDSLATHMSRVAYWLQHGSFFPWPSQRTWQITYPVNMQMQMFWTMLFLRSDRIVEIVQWLGALAAMVAVFGLARLLGASRPQALFSALILATFPKLSWKPPRPKMTWLPARFLLQPGTCFSWGSLSVPGRFISTGGGAGPFWSGLWVGTRDQANPDFPSTWSGPGAAPYSSLCVDGGNLFRSLILWAAGGLGAFLLLGVYMFVVNLVNFGHPMGPEAAVSGQTGGQTRQALVENFTFNTFRLAYQSIDPTGLPDPLTGYSFKLKGLISEKLTRQSIFR